MRYKFLIHRAVSTTNVSQEFSTFQLIRVNHCEFVTSKYVSHSHLQELWTWLKANALASPSLYVLHPWRIGWSLLLFPASDPALFLYQRKMVATYRYSGDLERVCRWMIVKMPENMTTFIGRHLLTMSAHSGAHILNTLCCIMLNDGIFLYRKKGSQDAL